MKTTLIALNEKLAVTEDLRTDGEQFHSYFKESEATRKELQNGMHSTSVNITTFQKENSTQHNKLQMDIDTLQNKLAVQKDFQAKRDNEHAQQLDA
jgi:hypothetical protein